MVSIPDNRIEPLLTVIIDLDELGDNEQKKANDVRYD